jgi:putative aminopeptidase FrvX
MAVNIELLKELSEAHGAPGHEEDIKKIFLRETQKLGELVEDQIGGCAVKISSGSKKGATKVFLGAHFDEVGFIVQNIYDNGFIQIHPLGGWWGHVLLAQRLSIKSRKTNKIITGIVCSIPPHYLKSRDKVIDIAEMFVDIGAKSKAEVEKLGIQLGDPIVPDSKFQQLHGDLYLGKAFDNRAGVGVAIETAKILAKSKLNAEVYIGCTVQEEMGLRGARALAYKLNVEKAILLEGAPSDDTPGLNPQESQTKIGGGVQVRIMDSSAIMSREMTDFTLKVATDRKIPTQVCVRKTGGTDAGSFHLTREGVKCCVIATPCRYIHTHNALINIKDYEQTIQLSVEMLKKL